jgi:hypothetical protein
VRAIAKGKGRKEKATRLHSLVVRSRGRCERCGITDYPKLQCAHIIGRRFAATRTDERNAWCLCARCHFRLTEHPDEHMAFVGQTIGMDAFHELKTKALAGVKTSEAFWTAEVERLQALLNQADAA